MEETIIEVFDTTLRDGEQSPEGGRINYTAAQKLTIATFLLTQLKVNRVEVTSAKVSTGEQAMLQKVMSWAHENGHRDKIEVLGFVDGHKSVDWICAVGGQVMNLLCKGSLLHCREQLKTDAQGHLANIRETVNYAHECGLTVNIYLEDWSYGMIDSPEYVEEILKGLSGINIGHVMLCDTRGVLNPWQVEEFINQVASWYSDKIDYHGHDDYGMATANTLFAVRTGKVSAVHMTVNGMGERAGNAALEQVVVGIADHCKGFTTQVDESLLREAATIVASNSGRRVAVNSPIVGNVFANTAGIHAHGGSIYEHPWLKPERFGAVMTDTLGKLSGRASVRNNLERLGFSLSDEDILAVAAQVVRLSDDGAVIQISDLPYIVAEVQNRPELVVFEVIRAHSHSSLNERAVTSATIKYKDKEYSFVAYGDGGFDAFMTGLRQLRGSECSDLVVPTLLDYDPSIPYGSETSGALVQANIVWRGENGEGEFPTFALDSDSTMAAIKAAVKAVNTCNCPR